MKPIKNYDQIKTDSTRRLPIDAYVCKILGVEHENNYLKVSLDIAEGDYKDYFMIDWKNQDREDKEWHCTYRLYDVKDDGSERDGWSARKLKTFTTALEESNKGYRWDWDESKWKGLLVGIIFQDYLKPKAEVKENEDPYWHSAITYGSTTVECVRTGDYKIPKPKIKDGGAVATSTTVPGVNAFVEVADSIDEELPFK